jgi:uncharacterized BrkB/YihY/UPF0761 family membrane protein
MNEANFTRIKSAIQHGRVTASRFKRDQAMRIASQMGYVGILSCAFVRGFRKVQQCKSE